MSLRPSTWMLTACLCLCLAFGSVSVRTEPVGAANLAITTSELSPLVLVETTRPNLTLFGHLSHWGLGAPAHVAFAGKNGVLAPPAAGSGDSNIRTSGAGLTLEGKQLAESWLLVWFQGAQGWTQWDSPWLVVWQHRPTLIRLDAEGLHAAGNGSLGHIALMPLYGLCKPKTKTWEKPPAEVIQRCRFWARTARDYPIACDETFRLDPPSDSLIVRSRFRWLATQDDWKTPPLRFAPLSPTLGLALQSKRMPMTVSAPVHAPNLCTAYGPYLGIENMDQYEVRFPILHYVLQTEQETAPDVHAPVVGAALQRLRQAMTETFSSGDGFFHPDFGDPKNDTAPPPQTSDGGNTCWALMSAQYYCRALPYVPPDVAAKARPRLRRYFADWVLQPGRYKPFRGKLLLAGPGIGTWGGYDDAGKFSSNTLLTLYTYGRYTGDWTLLKERWPLIQQLFVTPRECSWRTWGRKEIAEMGDEAAPALAMARMAYFVGDRDMFGYATYIFARELVHHVVKHTGAAYFVQRQPINSAEPMPADVYLTNLWGDTAGWQIDGPTWPRQTGERQYTNRWVRFGDPDVARFHRDHLQDLDRAELDGLLASGRFTRLRKETLDDPHILPSMVRLRSLLLNESPDTLAKITPVDARVHSNSGVAAYCMAFLRTSHPTTFATLIPTEGARRDWAPGIAREVEDEPVLTSVISWTAGKPARVGPPALTSWGWKPPHSEPGIPGGDRWSFGQIETDRPVNAATAKRLSWNTETVMLQ